MSASAGSKFVKVFKVLGIKILNACEHIYWHTLAFVYMKDIFVFHISLSFKCLEQNEFEVL